MYYIKKTLLYVLIQLLLLGFCLPLDTITVGQSIRNEEILVSSEEKFALGFFSPGKSRNRYVGIWFNKVSVQTVVWVANRDHPINDTSGVLSLNNNGNLELHHKYSNLPIWFTNVSATVTNGTASAKLLDIGNLVLSQTDSKGIIWQSFDCPTNIMLPNYKVGLNRRTNVSRFLQSWKTSDDPSAGSITYKMDTSGQYQLFMYKNGIPKWRIGPWNGEELNGYPQPQKTNTFRVMFVNNDDEVSNFYQVDKSIIVQSTLEESGILRTYIWNDREQRWIGVWSAPQNDCDNYGLCGPNSNCNPFTDEQFRCTCLPGYEPKSYQYVNGNRSGGCQRKQHASVCGNGEGFVQVKDVKVPDTSMVLVEMNLSQKECNLGCLRDCSCTAYASADVRGGGSGCIIWYGSLTDTEMLADGGHELYIRVDASELEKHKSKRFSAKKGMLLAILVSSVAVIFLLTAFSVYWFRKRKRKAIRYLNNDSTREEENHEGGEHPSVPFFSLGKVIAATDNFSSGNKLGEGGFGPVYKGRLVNGLEIAVKRLSKSSGQGATEFKNEVKLIAKLQHRNLVRLLGFCIHKDERMLIYEYLPNKGLDIFIFDETRRSVLNWTKRFDIIFGIARGVLYLHQDSRLKIIHRDLKASNVLLDATMNPKISDFGMARMVGEDQIQGSTNRIVGTYGYMSPEYAMEGRYSTQSDVFSFGVILLEIITGKRNTNQENERSSRNLIEYVWDLWREGKALELVDSTLEQSYPIPQVMRCIQLGLLCVQECANDRPTMFTVVFMLGSETTLPSPKKPAYIYTGKQNQSDSSASGGGGSSVCDMTMSLINGR